MRQRPRMVHLVLFPKFHKTEIEVENLTTGIQHEI